VTAGPGQATEVLCLMNMITEDELADEEEYEGIMLVVDEECVISWHQTNHLLFS